MSIEEKRAKLYEMARHRNALVEEAVSGVVGNIECVSKAIDADKPTEAGQHAFYALTHLAVLIGNIAAALNESAVAAQELSLIASENFRLDQEDAQRRAKESLKLNERDYIGKQRN